MKNFEYTIKDELGIHARPAGMPEKTADGYKSVVTIENGTKKAEAKRVMAIMGMGVQKGTTVSVTDEGEDEKEDCAAMVEIFKSNL